MPKSKVSNAEISNAEKGGMSFEKRCEEALTSLKRLWQLFQDLTNVGLKFWQESMRDKGEFLASLDESARKQAVPLVEELIRGRTEEEERFYKEVWEIALKLNREMYGIDAVEFALKALDAERRRN